VIAFRDVHKGFGPKRVLEGFSLEIPDGETTVIVGYSGSGKSVALKLIVGLLEPDFGAVEVDGAAVHELDRDGLTALRARIGFVFQFAALFDSMTVAENRGHHRAHARGAHPRGAGGQRGPLPGGAVGRDAQAGGHRPGDCAPAQIYPI
jgi:phospholipid/cholesterol/gamma-HCH transport system ATP-binding protein